MERVLVMGPCGAGKSTLAGKLGPKLGLPVHHLDQLHWKAGWLEGSKQELRDALEPVLAARRWLIEGNYGSTMEPRLARADTVIYLDYPITLCLWRALNRVWRYHGQSRPDMTSGCPERFDPAFFYYIARWNAGPRLRTERLLEGAACDIIRFRTPAELDGWLAKLEDNR